MPKRPQNRHDAYRLTDNESRRRYYDDWAGTYDTEHAQKTGYVYPDAVACRFLELAGPEDSPVADLGCGTGLAGLAFADLELAIDGFDVSQGMLDQARAKGVYRHLRQADLTNGRNMPRGEYRGLISCGTFTVGHLGPDDLRKSLVMAREGALCVIGVNAKHFDEGRFSELLDGLASDGAVCELRIEDARVYTKVSDSDKINQAKLAIFRIAGQLA